jgi:hypothetical protein
LHRYAALQKSIVVEPLKAIRVFQGFPLGPGRIDRFSVEKAQLPW